MRNVSGVERRSQVRFYQELTDARNGMTGSVVMLKLLGNGNLLWYKLLANTLGFKMTTSIVFIMALLILSVFKSQVKDFRAFSAAW